MKLDLRDIAIVPKMSMIESRQDVRSVYANKVGNASFLNGSLPLFTAPMDRVVSSKNAKQFEDAGVTVVLPRGVAPTSEKQITSYSMDEMINMVKGGMLTSNGRYLIDIANGHSFRLVKTISLVKEKYPDVFLMVGNIANPNDFKTLSEAGADAIRMSIGSGGSCSTTMFTGVGYGLASLISETRAIANRMAKPAMIIADGGMRNHSDIIKSLALGADAVMVGGIFNSMIESCAKSMLFGVIPISIKQAEICFKWGLPIYKSMRGMSTTEVQKDWGRKPNEMRASEGLVSNNKVKYQLLNWIWHFDSYLRSAMSYTDSATLEDFISGFNWTHVSNNVWERVNIKNK